MKRRLLFFAFIIFSCIHFTFGQNLPTGTGAFIDYPVTGGYYSWETVPFESYKEESHSTSTHFRIKFPPGYEYGGGTKYPVIVFFHGAGEFGTDNRKQLIHGGQRHHDAVESGEFPGIVIYPQKAVSDTWNTVFPVLRLVTAVFNNADVDPDRIYIHGLSAGGKGTWKFLNEFSNCVAAAAPMAQSPLYQVTDPTNLSRKECTPIWLSQGGNDKVQGASPADANEIVRILRNNGSNITYTYYPTGGHGIWGSTYWHRDPETNSPDFFKWFLAKKLNDIHVFFEEEKLCAGETLSVVLGAKPGHSEYEWRKDGVVIDGAITNKLMVNQPGTYEVRFKRSAAYPGFTWPGTKNEDDPTPWSDPVIISLDREKTPVVTISNKNQSVNLPALNGSTTADLVAPPNQADYQWYRDINIVQAGADSIYSASISGTYGAIVREAQAQDYFIDNLSDYDGDGAPEPKEVPLEYRPAAPRCVSDLSNLITVTTENLSGVPNKPKNVFLTLNTPSSVLINWDDNATNELGYEIYKAVNPGGPYTLIEITSQKTSQDPQSFIDVNLDQSTTYYYVLRAVNDKGGSEYTTEKSISTITDTEPPSTSQLNVLLWNTNYVDLAWTRASDNFSVLLYNIYLDGNLYTSISDTTVRVSGLSPETLYQFYIEAVDEAGNASNPSNIVTQATVINGVLYSYYEGVWDLLPEFTQLTPVASGIIANVSLSPKLKNDYFGFKYEAIINIPTTGTYTFYTTSDDGSKLYINGNQVVNNDGLHGEEERNGQVVLSAGQHNFGVTFFEKDQGEGLVVSWEGPGIAKQSIPNSAFINDFEYPLVPDAPSAFTANASTYNQVDLSWTDDISDETNFEIYRSGSLRGPFNIITTLPAGANSFLDNSVSASTSYFYQITTINNQGSSILPNQDYRVFMSLNGNLNDISESPVTNTVSGTAIYSTTEFVEGNSSLDFPSTNTFISVDNGGSFLRSEFSERAISLWFKTADVTTTQTLFEEGGSTNGIALRVIGGNLEFGVRNSSPTTLLSISVSANVWNHVVGVFCNGKLSLYLNGVLANSNDNVGYSSVSSHTNPAGLGGTNGSDAFGSSTGLYFKGFIDAFMIYTRTLNSNDVVQLYNFPKSLASATTPEPPALPAAPSTLTANGISSTQIDLAWMDNSDNDTGFEIYRTTSPLDIGWILIHTTLPGVTSYSNTGLDGNSTYYYKARAVSNEQVSDYSNIVNASTANNAPVFTNLLDRSMELNGTLNIQVGTVDPDGDALIINASDIPTFGTFTDHLDGSATLSFAVGSTCPGGICSYLISLTVTDGDIITQEDFTLSISQNTDPVLTAIADQAMDEGRLLDVDITIKDVDNDVKVVVLGSSTAAGTGATPSDSSWVNRLDNYLKNISNSAKVVKLAKIGFSTEDIRPIGPESDPDITRNIDAAVAQNPDIIIVNLASNNVAQDISIPITITHYIEIKDMADANGIPIFFTTTQPRNFDGETLSGISTPAERRQFLADEAQAVRDNFGNLVIDIYDELTDFDNEKRIKANYNSGDNIHLNNAGHKYIFSTVKASLVNYAGINNPNVQVSNLPAFASIIKDINGTNLIRLKPGYYDAGTYAEIEVIALDGKGGVASDKFNLAVNNTTEASSIFLNFNEETGTTIDPWRKTGAYTTGSISDIIDDKGYNTGWTLNFTTNAGLDWTETQTGNAVSGIYPSEVMGTRFKFTSANATDFVEMELTDLKPELKYDLVLFGSRDESTGEVINTNYTIGEITKTLNIAENTNNTVVFQDIAADALGNIKIRVSQGTSTSTTCAYLNSLIVYSFFDSGLPPTAPNNLDATLNDENEVVLTWSDNSDNERRFVIYRSTSLNGTYDSLGSVLPNIETFTDSKNVLGHTTYYYKIAAKNNNDATYSAVKSILTLNNKPQLFTNLMYSVPADQLTNIPITGSDPDGDLLTYEGVNMPSFVKVLSNGDGTGTLEFNPETYDIGNFTGSKVYAQEAYQGFDDNGIYINVLSGEFDEQVYVDFSPVSEFDEAPFNTIATSPISGNSYSSLRNISSIPTSINMVVGNGWSGASFSGESTLTNTGVIIDTVLKSNWYTASTATLTFNGLETGKLYNFTFFGSNVDATSAAKYSSGGNSVDLITGANTTNSAQLNGILPSSNKIDVSIEKINSSINGHISAILIQAYNPSIIPAPTNLTVIGGENELVELRWSDNSGNETGFEIYRKVLPDGTSTLIAPIIPITSNQTSYIDDELSPNTTYEYRIRAISPTGYSNYSNTAFGSTYQFQVKVNVSGPGTNNMEPNWENLYASPENGQNYTELINDTGGSTVIDLSMDEIGVGFDQNIGAVTGDDSGVYPDAVMNSFYFYEPNDDLGQWSIKDLDPNYAYNITLTGSVEGWLLDEFNAKGITEYIVNNKSLFLDTRDNTNGTVTFYNVYPNENSEIILNIRAAKIPGVNYGLLNAIVIQGYNKVDRADGENFYTYYARNNTNISETTNWNTRIDGTGAVLPSFNDSGIEYIIDGNSNVSAANNLTIGGSGSIVKVKEDATINLSATVSNFQIPDLVVYDGKSLNLTTSAPSAPSLTVSGGGIAIRNGAVLDIDSLNMTITGTGGINKNGEVGQIAVKDGSLSLLGTSNLDQHLYFLPGRDTLKSFTLNNTGTGSVLLGNKMHARNSVKLHDGVLNANGNLVLVSDINATANLLKIESGASIVGNVEYQRYWTRPVGTVGFFYLGSPILNQTVSDWVGEFRINGLSSSSWKNLNFWNEPLNKWEGIGSASTPILPGKGINAFLFSQDFADQFIRYNNVGPIQQGNYTFDLTYTTGTNPGWNLVANPYPCAIDWSTIPLSDPAFANRVDAAFYVWDQANGSYKTWTPATLESPLIASGQGFFIHTNQDNENPILFTVTEDIKIDSLPTFLRQSPKDNILQIIAENSGQRQDVAYVSLFDGATPGFDSHLDGKKLASSYVNLSSVSETGDNLAVNALPTDKKEYSIPLIIKSTQEGTMSFTFNNVSSFNENYDLVLVDLFKDTRSEIREGIVYSFTIVNDDTSTYGNNRFQIEINKVLDKVTVSGGILNRYNQPIGQVSLSAIKESEAEQIVVETSDLGFFSMKLISLNPYAFSPEKTGIYDAATVNFVDYVALHWISKGWSNFIGDTEFIAADLDNSGDIGQPDLKTLRKIITRHPKQEKGTFEYRFVSEDNFKVDREGLSYTLNNGLNILPQLNTQNIINIRGVIPGDIVIGRDKNYNREAFVTAPLEFEIGTPVKNSTGYHIPVYGRNFTNITGFMLNTSNIVREIEMNEIPKSGEFVYADDPGRTIIWTSEAGKGSTLADGALLFHLVVNENDVHAFITNAINSNSHIAVNGDFSQVELKFEDLSRFGENGNAFLGAYPNPFTDHVAFRLKIEKPETAKFYFFSANGAVIHEATLNLNVGLHDLDLEKDLGYHGHISKGLTIFRIQFADMIITDKLIRK